MHSECVFKIGLIGINYKTADLPLREIVSMTAESLRGEKALFFPHPTVLLNTCNRTEIYFSALDLADAHQELLGFLKKGIQAPFEQKLYTFFGFDCFVHLSRVAAGLDSAILAESEIQRQVKTAYLKAKGALFLPSCLHYAFQKALHVSKAVRSHLTFDHDAPTLYGTLIRLAEKTLGNLGEKKILLIGNSEINRGFALFLEKRGVDSFVFCTKDPSKIKGRAIDRSQIECWREFDLIVSASQADGYLVKGNGGKRHLIFDLSVPRTVDPALKNFPEVFLYNIEEINQMIEEKRVARKETLDECEEKVYEHVYRLARLYRKKVEYRESYAVER